MNENASGLMVLAFDTAPDSLTVKWSNDLSVESPQFYQTIVALFNVIQDKKIANLIIDSGIPAGGVLTEEVIYYFIQHIPNTPLKQIALLESPDFLWDNNLYQVIKLLITNYKLPIAIELHKSHDAARAWLSQSLQPQPDDKQVHYQAQSK